MRAVPRRIHPLRSDLTGSAWARCVVPPGFGRYSVPTSGTRVTRRLRLGATVLCLCTLVAGGAAPRGWDRRPRTPALVRAKCERASGRRTTSSSGRSAQECSASRSATPATSWCNSTSSCAERALPRLMTARPEREHASGPRQGQRGMFAATCGWLGRMLGSWPSHLPVRGSAAAARGRDAPVRVCGRLPPAT